MIKISTISVKIKTTKALKAWFLEQSQKAADLYNKCLDLQFELVNNCKQIHTAFDLANHFRDYPLGSDYKDRIFERVADSTKKWIKSESLRYEIYWDHKEKIKTDKYKTNSKNSNKKNVQLFEKFPYLKLISTQIEQRDNYRTHIINLSRKQKIHGKPRKRKTISLGFSIRKTRQNTIQFKRKKIECTIPKFKTKISGKYNFLPGTGDYKFKLATLKTDRCKTLWIKLTIEENLSSSIEILAPNKEKILVGVDMGL